MLSGFSVCVEGHERPGQQCPAPQQRSVGTECPPCSGPSLPGEELTSSPCAQREDVAASPSLMGAGDAHTQVTSRGGLSETLWGIVVPCAQAACCQSDRLSA